MEEKRGKDSCIFTVQWDNRSRASQLILFIQSFIHSYIRSLNSSSSTLHDHAVFPIRPRTTTTDYYTTKYLCLSLCLSLYIRVIVGYICGWMRQGKIDIISIMVKIVSQYNHLFPFPLPFLFIVVCPFEGWLAVHTFVDSREKGAAGTCLKRWNILNRNFW